MAGGRSSRRDKAGSPAADRAPALRAHAHYPFSLRSTRRCNQPGDSPHEVAPLFPGLTQALRRHSRASPTLLPQGALHTRHTAEHVAPLISGRSGNREHVLTSRLPAWAVVLTATWAVAQDTGASSLDQRQQLMQESFWCEAMGSLTVTVRPGYMAGGTGTLSIDGERLASDPPPINGASVGVTYIVNGDSEPKLRGNHVELSLARSAAAQIAEIVKASGESIYVIQVSNPEGPLFTRTFFAPIPNRRLYFARNTDVLEPADVFIEGQQQSLCPTRPSAGSLAKPK